MAYIAATASYQRTPCLPLSEVHRNTRAHRDKHAHRFPVSLVRAGSTLSPEAGTSGPAAPDTRSPDAKAQPPAPARVS